jgi:glycopeptide antibiotics resistance protein
MLTFLPLPIGAEAIAEARLHATSHHNAVPLETLRFQLQDGVTPVELRQLIGNVVLLLPLGIYGPVIWPRLRSAGAVLVTGIAVSSVIELGQLAVATAYGFPVRVADIDDVILNTLGVLLGYLVWRLASSNAAVDSNHAVRGPAD